MNVTKIWTSFATLAFALVSLAAAQAVVISPPVSSPPTVEWIQQLGGSGFDYNYDYGNESSYGVSADGLGNVYISGSTSDGTETNENSFVSKYDAAGNIQWTKQLGASDIDQSTGVSADGLGNVYISGFTHGDLDGPNAGGGDAFVSKYDAAGNIQWTEQLGSDTLDLSYGVSADGLGNVYISGRTWGDLDGPNAGSGDAFVSKFDATGNIQWTKQLGTSGIDQSTGVSADGLGNVYISGYTRGGLDGPNAGGSDAFVSKFDAAGNIQWTEQLGSDTPDLSTGVSADGLGNVYLSGYTHGDLGGPNAGGRDAFVVKISSPEVPEPSTLLLAGVAGVGLLGVRWGVGELAFR